MIQALEENHYFGHGLSVFTGNMDLPRHRWYEFKEGFAERLVNEAVQNVASGSKRLNVLDPFCGSGTTLVACGRSGHNADGIEVNPFLAFAARAKCTSRKWRMPTFRKRLDSVLHKGRHEIVSPLEGLSTFGYRPKLDKWLFNRSVLRGLAALDAALCGAGQYRKPLRLALLASLIDCCNAKRDGKCLRYRKEWKSLGFTSRDLRDAFEARSHIVASDIVQRQFDGAGLRLIVGDARQKLRSLRARHYDLVVTSPPYLNSFDYSDVYRPELFAGGFVRSNAELRKIRLRTIRSHVQVGWEPSSEIVSDMLPPLIDEVASRKLWDRRLPAMIASYFADMAAVLRELARLVKRNGRAWIVVGTSAYAGVEIPVDLILADVATRNGWRLVSVNVLRQLRSAGQHKANGSPCRLLPLRESLVIVRR